MVAQSGQDLRLNQKEKEKEKKSTDSVDNEDERLSHSLPYTTGLRLHTDKTWAKLELTPSKSEKLQQVV